jgi:short-subunit dehydrogenase
VALDDALLKDTHAELAAEFPAVSFRAVGCNLGAPGASYVNTVHAATSDIDVQLVFLNAGYMLTGLYEATALAAQAANLECNAVSAASLAHVFLGRMVGAGKGGCIVLTSSAAAAVASPYTVMYAATKAFISSFGASLAVEARHRGVDVLVFHPSPVASRFYDRADRMSVLDFFKGVAVSPDALPGVVFGAVGRTVWRDVGLTAFAFRIMMKVVDFNFMALAASRAAPSTADFKAAVALADERRARRTGSAKDR